ncbi:MAG: primosomal protein N' [bacterium]
MGSIGTTVMLADVVVDLAVDKAFSYIVPPHLREKIQMGKRVWVPFRRGEIVGYVVGLSEGEGADLKEVIDVLDEEAVFSPEMLRLARWIGEYYECGWGEVLHAFLPAGVRLSGDRIVELNIPRERVGEFLPGAVSERQARILKFLLEREDPVNLNHIYRKIGKRGTYSAISSLRDKGLVRISSVLKQPSVGPKLKGAIYITENFDEGGLTEKQRRVLESLRNLGEPPSTIDELAFQAGVGAGVVSTLLKRGILERREVEVGRDPYGGRSFPESSPLTPTRWQSVALEKIKAGVDGGRPKVFLLHGITGSGKTEVYLQAIDYVLKKGKRVIVLIPEISLTPQTVQRFKSRFKGIEGRIAILHSALSMGERFDEWRRIKRGDVDIVIGARSAVFAPLENLGMIVVDEEHETSYKQEDKPRYHARDVAIVRAYIVGATVILGSATPSLESYHNAKTGKYTYLSLPERIDGRPLPKVRVVDMREELKRGNLSIFSVPLREAIADRLRKDEQIILFLNRRGFATFIFCRECGLSLRCRRCNVTLTYHIGSDTARCHYCNYETKVPSICPKCGGKQIKYFGLGTQRVETDTRRIFPSVKVVRMDRDTTRHKGSHERILSNFGRGKFDILVGTQMVAKGLDYPNVTLVGVISVDTTLNLPDFRASERTFQLITQVAGRTGRGKRGGSVIVQTYHPQEPSILFAADQNYERFYRYEIAVRRELGYPPFARMINVLFSGRNGGLVKAESERFAERARKAGGYNLTVMGPAPAYLSRLKGRYRWQVILKGKSQSQLHAALDSAIRDMGEISRAVSLTIDVDPVGLI